MSNSRCDAGAARWPCIALVNAQLVSARIAYPYAVLSSASARCAHCCSAHLPACSLVIALWPIWGFVTLPIMIVLSFAACLGPNLLPF